MNPLAELHVTLPQQLLTDLDRIASERGLRRIQLVREALASYVADVESDRVRREMEIYAEDLAAESREFAGESELHIVERLLRESEW